MKYLSGFKIIPILVLVLVVAFVLLRTTQRTTPKYNVNLSSQTVIKQIQTLNRLETASFTIEKIIDVGTSGGRIRQLLVGDRILLIAHGNIIAGFDLQKMTEDNVGVSGETLKLTLPAPEILVVKLDNDETRVYDRRQGLLTKGDQDLETEARAEAEKVIRDAACKGGVLNEASKNARSQLTSLFKGVGFETVIIEIPEGSC